MFLSAPLHIISIFILSLRHVYQFGLKCNEIFFITCLCRKWM